jgi:hypothetical protein
MSCPFWDKSLTRTTYLDQVAKHPWNPGAFVAGRAAQAILVKVNGDIHTA